MSGVACPSDFRVFLLAGFFCQSEELLEHVLGQFCCGDHVETEIWLGPTYLACFHQHRVLDVGNGVLSEPASRGGVPDVDIGPAEPGFDEQGGHLLRRGGDGVERLFFHSALASILGPLADVQDGCPRHSSADGDTGNGGAA